MKTKSDKPIKDILIIGNNLNEMQHITIILDNFMFNNKIFKAMDCISADHYLKKECFSLIIIKFSDNFFEIIDKDILSNILSRNNNTKVIFIHKNDNYLIDDIKLIGKDINQLYYLQEPFKIIDFANLVGEYIIKLDEIDNLQQKKLFPVKITLLKDIESLPFQLFLRLGQNKFVKIYKENNPHLHELIIKYEKNKIEELYAKWEDLSQFDQLIFSTKYVEMIFKKNKKQFTLNSQIMIHEVVKEIGINEYALKMAEQAIESIISEVDDLSLEYTLNEMKSDECSFIYDHSYLTAILATAMANKMLWSSQQIIEKLCLASLFHDLGISNSKLALKESNNPLDLNKLPKAIRNEINDHPSLMAEKLSLNKNIPIEVINIVKYHHQGLGNIQNLNLSPVCFLFIIAHEFTTRLFKKAFRTDKINEIMKDLKEDFNKNCYRDILSVLESLLSNNKLL